MDRVGGTIKNVVFRQVNSGKEIINLPKKIIDVANDLCRQYLHYFKKENICYASLMKNIDWKYQMVWREFISVSFQMEKYSRIFFN